MQYQHNTKAMNSEQKKPLLLYATFPPVGHMTPALQVMEYLVSRGFEVGAITADVWRPAMEHIGVKWFPFFGVLESVKTMSVMMETELSPNMTTRQRTAAHAELFAVAAMPSSLESIRSALMRIRHAHSDSPDREIILLCDYLCAGALPLRLGAVVPGFGEKQPIKSILINIIPPVWTAAQNPPPWSGLAFDDSEAGLARNEVLASSWPPEQIRAEVHKMLRYCGVTTPGDHFLQPYMNDGAHHSVFENWFVCHSTTLQMCSPSAEYPTTSWPSHCKLAGFLPIKSLPANLSLPDWFADLQDARAKGKKIVFVAQGTVVTNYRSLVIPTIAALAGRNDVLVVVVLCVRGATLELDEGQTLPNNVRVADHLPYDAILPYADIFVSNSGYGGLTHAVNHGVPLIQAGTTEDKMDIGRRIQYAGLGEYIRPVSVDSIRSAVDRLLKDNRYRKRAVQIKDESDDMDSLRVIENEIMELSKKGYN